MKKTLAAGLPLAGLLAVSAVGVAKAQVEGEWVDTPIPPLQSDEMPVMGFQEMHSEPLVEVKMPVVQVQMQDVWETTAERMRRVALPESEPPWKTLCKTGEVQEEQADNSTEEQP
ncbi:MAG: hypothetical protein IK066_03510 [Kiritimatiellae bacterium]|nr:hypothetical protein [Kiritimatiellia bacterium]